jgi:ribulose-phosphate 3-epimerase
LGGIILTLIAPSLLAADLGIIREEALAAANGGADWLHIDIMDGRFVPNISFGVEMIRTLRKTLSKTHLDVHLMTEDPHRFLEESAAAGANSISVHYEACDHLHRVVQQIKGLGLEAGVALNPHTKVELIEYILPSIDYVLIMSVNPGFGGQKLLDLSYKKIKALHDLNLQLNLKTRIIVDGGVSLANASELIKSGADVLVVGTAVFAQSNYANAISGLRLI